MCPLGQHLNIKKSLFFADLLDKSGIPCIPHIYAISDNQRKRVISWLNNNPQVRIIAINCQLQKPRYHFNVLKETVKSILEGTNGRVHIILEGLRVDRLCEFGWCIWYLHVSLKAPLMRALFGRKSGSSKGKNRLAKEHKTKEERQLLASKNIKYYQVSINKILLESVSVPTKPHGIPIL